MKEFSKYEDFQNHYINLLMSLSMVQEEVPPELFEPLADSFLNNLKQGKRLYGITHNVKQEQREERYRQRLRRRGWRKRIRAEISDNNCKLDCSDIGAVKEQAKSEADAERINSAAVYVSPLDCDNERKELPGLAEEGTSSAGLVADSSVTDLRENRLPN